MRAFKKKNINKSWFQSIHYIWQTRKLYSSA